MFVPIQLTEVAMYGSSSSDLKFKELDKGSLFIIPSCPVYKTVCSNLRYFPLLIPCADNLPAFSLPVLPVIASS